jgi:PD-(D/E)XK nuclease superfamily
MLDLGPVKAWSYSSLKKFEQCPYGIQLAKVDKLKGPERDENHPAERGNKIHKLAEDFVQGKLTDLPKPLRKFEGDFNLLRGMFADGMVTVEEDWGFTSDWGITGWMAPDTWARLKCDVVVHHDEKHLTVIDHKTGKKFGNEVPHTQQGQLYAVGAFMRYPDVEVISVEFFYLDEGKKSKKTYTREKALKYMKRFTDRAVAMTTCKVFNPKPNKFNCQWCDFGVNKGTGECPYAVGDL